MTPELDEMSPETSETSETSEALEVLEAPVPDNLQESELDLSSPLVMLSRALSPYLIHKCDKEKLEGELGPLSIKRLSRALEELLIREALKRNGGVKTQAARALEISTKTLLYKMRDYQVMDANEE